MRPVSNVNPESCSICFADYEEEGEKKPKLLPCSHTYCLECLRSLISHHKVECPVCRKTQSVPSGGADKFPTNRDIVQVNRLVARLQRVRSEGESPGEAPEGVLQEGIPPPGLQIQNPPPENPYLHPSAFGDAASPPSPTAPGLEPSAPAGGVGADGTRPDSVVLEGNGGELVLIPESLLRQLSQSPANASTNRDTIVVGRARDTNNIRESGDSSDAYSYTSSTYEPEQEPEVTPSTPEVMYRRPEVMPEVDRAHPPQTFHPFGYDTKEEDAPRRRRRGWCYSPWCKAWAVCFGVVFLLAVGGGLIKVFLF